MPLPTPLSRILSFLRSRDHASNLVVFAMCFQVPDLFVIKYGVYRAYFVYFNREAIQFGKWTFVDICKRFEEHIRHWTFIFFAENHSHRLYVNKERVDCEFSLCASDCATVLYFCGPWPYGL